MENPFWNPWRVAKIFVNGKEIVKSRLTKITQNLKVIGSNATFIKLFHQNLMTEKKYPKPKNRFFELLRFCCLNFPLLFSWQHFPYKMYHRSLQNRVFPWRFAPFFPSGGTFKKFLAFSEISADGGRRTLSFFSGASALTRTLKSD